MWFCVNSTCIIIELVIRLAIGLCCTRLYDYHKGQLYFNTLKSKHFLILCLWNLSQVWFQHTSVTCKWCISLILKQVHACTVLKVLKKPVWEPTWSIILFLNGGSPNEMKKMETKFNEKKTQTVKLVENTFKSRVVSSKKSQKIYISKF